MDNINQTLPKAEQRKLDSSHLREPLLTVCQRRHPLHGRRRSMLKFRGSYQQNHRELRKTDKVRCWQMMLRLHNPVVGFQLSCSWLWMTCPTDWAAAPCRPPPARPFRCMASPRLI